MQSVYLICFLTALVLIALSFLLGFVHVGGGHGVHLDSGGVHGANGGLHAGHGGGGGPGGGGGVHGGGGHGGAMEAGHAVEGGGEQQGASVSPINLNTLLGFALGFGGVGSLFTYGLHWPALLSLLPALAGGLGGGWLIWRLLDLLMRASRFLNPADYRMEGALGKVTVTIRTGGTGEIVYTQGGSRHACAARSASNSPIARDEEVVVLRYEKGIAYVQPLQTKGPVS